MFSCKFAVYPQNTFSKEHLWTAASVLDNKRISISCLPTSIEESLKSNEEEVDTKVILYNHQILKSNETSVSTIRSPLRYSEIVVLAEFQ